MLTPEHVLALATLARHPLTVDRLSQLRFPPPRHPRHVLAQASLFTALAKLVLFTSNAFNVDPGSPVLLVLNSI